MIDQLIVFGTLVVTLVLFLTGRTSTELRDISCRVLQRGMLGSRQAVAEANARVAP